MTIIKATSRNPGGQLGDLQALLGNGTYELAALISCQEPEFITITGSIGAAALTGLQISAAAMVGGTHVTRLTDADFDTSTDPLIEFSTPSPYLTAANGVFQCRFDVRGIDELKIYAKAAAPTSLSLEVGV